MLFKILYNKDGLQRGTAFAYCKKKSEIKRFKKITTRGLSRVMWGKDLPAIGAQIPSTIQRLMRKAPGLLTVNLNKIYIKKTGDETVLNITNDVSKLERYAKIAEKHGYKKIMSGIMRALKKLVEKDIKL